jgi:hypothetical protein
VSQRVITIDDGDQVVELPHGAKVLDLSGGEGFEQSDVVQVIRLDDDDDHDRCHHHHH